MRDDPVKGRPVLFILVDADVDVLAQEASALGTAHGVGVVDSPGKRVPPSPVKWGRGVFQEGDGIPHGDEPQSHDPAYVRGVDQLVNLPRIEAGGHVDVAVLRLHVLILDPDEGPLAPIDSGGGTVGQVPHRQGGLCLLGVGCRIGQVLPV